MKNSQIIIVVSAIILIAVFIFMGSKKNNTEITYTPPITEESTSIVGCYVATLGKDVYTLSILSQEGDNVSGTLNFKNFEKDSSSGTYVATYTNDILLGDYSFTSEGMDSVMQVIFKKKGEDFIRGYGEVDSTGASFVDLENITYDEKVIFKASACLQ